MCTDKKSNSRVNNTCRFANQNMNFFMRWKTLIDVGFIYFSVQPDDCFTAADEE